MTFHFQGHLLNKFSHIKFNEYPPTGSRVVLYGLTDGRTDAQTDGTDRGTDRDTTKLIVAFCNFVNAPTKLTNFLPVKYVMNLSRLLSTTLHYVSKFSCPR